jgi:hypothetical protein
LIASAVLAARIKEYLLDVERVVERIYQLQEKALRTGDDGYWDAVALNLHSYYSGIERICEDIARTMDEVLPNGPDWHRVLLMQLSVGVPERRPAVFERDTRLCLDEYRGFRHIVRNVYAFNFRPERLNELVERLGDCFSRAKHDLTVFVDFLEAL